MRLSIKSRFASFEEKIFSMLKIKIASLRVAAPQKRVASVFSQNLYYRCELCSQE